MGTGGWPDFNQFLNEVWGWSWEVSPGFSGAVNFIYGQNPPYTLDDFWSVYPDFFGAPTSIANASTTQGSQTIGVTSVNGLAIGQFIQGLGLPKGSVITGTGNQQITINNQATATASNVVLTVYQTPPIPLTVIQIYINLAVASLVQARWQDSWLIGIAWFVAHYCTLFAKSASKVTTLLQASTHSETPAGAIPGTIYALSAQPPGGALQGLFRNGAFQTPGVDYALNGVTITLIVPTVSGDVLRATWTTQTSVQTTGYPNAAQLAAQGIGNGIQVSKSVGDVSESFTPLVALESWGTLNLTVPGQQLADMARVIGMGPALIWAIIFALMLSAPWIS